MKTVRSFIAIEIPSTIQKNIETYQQPLRKMGGGVSWVKAKNIHLTLKFLGDVPETQINDISNKIFETCANVPQFKISITGTGFFPNAKRPKIVWVGCQEPSGTLTILQKAIDARLSEIGFERETRKFSPHLTIGRIKNPLGIQDMVQKVETGKFDGGEFVVREIILMQSQLHPGGSIYTPLSKINLQTT